MECRFLNNIGNDCLVLVDGTDFCINKPMPYSPKWYSHKFNGPGLCYKVGISIINGDIVWINGPFPCGSWSDIKIFRNGLINELGHGERVEANSGYRGEPTKIKTPEMFGTEEEESRKILVRARHETANKRLKQFSCLKDVFRHNLQKHSSVFRAVAVITQLTIQHGSPLFSVEYQDDI